MPSPRQSPRQPPSSSIKHRLRSSRERESSPDTEDSDEIASFEGNSSEKVSPMKSPSVDHASKSEESLPSSSDEGIYLQKSAETVSVFGWSFDKVIFWVHLNIVLYSTCFWIQLQTLPYLVRLLNVDNTVYGYLQTTFAVFQLAGSPLFGRFGDLFGPRAALYLAYGSGVLTYGVLALASSVFMLFLSRTMSLFLSCMQGSQMVVTDIKNERDRADALGKLGISYCIGMVVGPLIGGQITTNMGEFSAAGVACAGSLVSIVIVYFFMPTQIKHVSKKDQTASNVFDLKKIYTLSKNRTVMFLLFIKSLEGLPLGMFQSMFSMIAMDTFGLTADKNGFLMSYVGVVTILVQGFGVGYLSKKYDDHKLLKWSAALLILAYFGLSVVTDVSHLVIVILPLVGGLTTMQVITSSAVTKSVTPADTGTILGVNMAVNSLIRMVSPTLGGLALQYWGFSAFGYLGMVSSVVVSALLFSGIRY